MATLRWGASTDPGRIRPENEDNVLAEPNVFAVADGMGGHRAGEVASALAVDMLRSRLSATRRSLDDVMAAIAEANGDIYRAAIGNPEQQGMGTTITALVVITETEPETEADGARRPRAARPRQRRRLPHLPACATAGCGASPSTTATCRSSSPPATSPTTRRATTRGATS